MESACTYVSMFILGEREREKMREGERRIDKPRKQTLSKNR